MSTSSPAGLRIGELARLAGVTTRAIRHYHDVGLLAEPGRDGSGYRRYAAADLIALVRIRRLRALGMPIEQIADRLAGRDDARPGTPGAEQNDMASALAALADDLDRQIRALTELRAKVRALAESPDADEPATTWAAALVSAGVLNDPGDLPAGERAAADLIDGLAPHGIGELARRVAALHPTPAARSRLDDALTRWRGLAPEAPAAETDALAADLAAAADELGLHRRRQGSETPAPVPIEVMDKLLGDRLSPAQLRCLHRVRQLLEAEGR